MKKFCRILSVFLSALILTAGISAFAAESCSITASSPQGVFADITKYYKAGDEFDLKVYVKADEPLLNGAVYFRFDSSALFAESFTAGGPLSSSSPIIAGSNNAEYQEKNGCVACNFTDTNSINYKTENILLTAHFKLKNADGNQNIKIDIKNLTGIADPSAPATMVPYIKSESVVEANKNKFTVRAELTGGNTQVETQAPTESAPETKPETQPVTIAPETQAPTEAPYKPGDVNRDGALSVKDATLIQKYLVRLEKLDDEQKALADINGDKSISIKDATKIQHIIAGLV